VADVADPAGHHLELIFEDETEWPANARGRLGGGAKDELFVTLTKARGAEALQAELSLLKCNLVGPAGGLPR
jgi:hypothetical protein